MRQTAAFVVVGAWSAVLAGCGLQAAPGGDAARSGVDAAAPVTAMDAPAADLAPPPEDAPDAPGLPLPRGPAMLDVLFVIGDEPGTAQLQTGLRRGFPAFVDQLARLPGGLPDLHLAVVASDLGAGPSAVPGCPILGGDRGLFRAGAGCLPGGERFIRTNGLGQNNFTGDLATVFACLADLGEGGCVFDQQLGAARIALTAAPQNGGFLRSDATLAIVLVGDRDDCSAGPATTFYGETPVDETPRLRCASAGHQCGGMPPAAAELSAPLASCMPAAGGPLIAPEEFAAAIKALKPDAGRVVVSAITGWPDGAGDARYGVGRQASGAYDLVPVCQGPGGEVTAALRVKRFVEAFGEGGSIFSACADLGFGLAQVGRAIGLRLAPPPRDPSERLDASGVPPDPVPPPPPTGGTDGMPPVGGAGGSVPPWDGAPPAPPPWDGGPPPSEDAPVADGDDGRALLEIRPPAWDFGASSIGQESAPATFVVTYQGNVARPVMAAVVGPDAPQFPIDSDGCGGHILEPGATCAIRVHFSPVAGGPRTATLNVVTADQRSTVAAALSGTGTIAPPPEQCNHLDDDGNGEVDEGFAYSEVAGTRHTITESALTGVWWIAPDGDGKHVAFSWMNGNGTPSDVIRVLVVATADGAPIGGPLSFGDYQASNFNALTWMDNRLFLTGTTRPYDCGGDTSLACATYGALLDNGGGLLTTQTRLASDTSTTGGFAWNGSEVLISFSPPTGGPVRVRSFTPAGASGAVDRTLLTPAPAEDLSNIRGVRGGDEIFWVYCSNPAGLRLLVTGLDGATLRGPVTLQAGGCLGDRFSPGVVVTHDTVYAAYGTASDTMVGRWSTSGAPLGSPTLVHAGVRNISFSTDGNQLYVGTIDGAGLNLARLSLAGRLVQKPTLVLAGATYGGVGAGPAGAIVSAGNSEGHQVIWQRVGCP